MNAASSPSEIELPKLKLSCRGEKPLEINLVGESNTWLDFVKSYLSLPYLYTAHRVKTLVLTDSVFIHYKTGDTAWFLLNKYSL